MAQVVLLDKTGFVAVLFIHTLPREIVFSPMASFQLYQEMGTTVACIEGNLIEGHLLVADLYRCATMNDVL